MRKVLIGWMVAFISALIVGCASDNTATGDKNEDQAEVILVQPAEFWTLTNRDDFIAEDGGKYLEFDLQTDYCASINAPKLDPLSNHIMTSFDGINESCALSTRSVPLSDCFQVKVNGISLGRDQNETMGYMAQENLKNVFGKNCDFVIGRKSATRSERAPDTTVNMYVPQLIEITSPSVKTGEDLFPLCYYEDMVLNWNADKDNENGVMVVVEWMGTMVFGAQQPDIYMRCIDVIAEDSGTTVLKNELFEDIPDTALVYITLLRGNIENLLIDDYSYKLVAESHAILPIILIRNLKNA
jgi:lipoprotein